MFKHIVAGCDGSPGGKDAVALGATLASLTDARLTLLAVIHTSFFPIAGGTDRKTLRTRATRWLRRERDLLAPSALIHTVADNSFPRALLHYAERGHADLVILGSDSSAAPGHASISRRGRQLLYDAPFSLGLAPRGLHERNGQIRACGVGYDATPEAEPALALAAALARTGGAELHVRRVVEDEVAGLSGEEWISGEDRGHEHMWSGALREALTEVRSAVSRLDVHAEVAATVGDPGYELRGVSEMVDLLIIGSRHWGTVARLWSSSVAETLVSDASCSILIVPRPATRRRSASKRRSRNPALV